VADDARPASWQCCARVSRYSLGWFPVAICPQVQCWETA
jgi:hypothetical protein